MISAQVKSRLIDIVGPENYDDSNAGRLVYSYDATPQFQSMPDAVVAPRSTKEVSRILKLCNTHRIPVVPRGSGTNLVQAHAPPKAVLSSCSSI